MLIFRGFKNENKKYMAAIILAASMSTGIITAQAKKKNVSNVSKEIKVENSKTTKNRKNAKNKKSKIKYLDTSSKDSKNSDVSSIKNLDLSSLNIKVGKDLKQFKIVYDFDKVADTDLNRCLGFFWYMNKLYENKSIDLDILKQLKVSTFNLLSQNFRAFNSNQSATVCLKDEEIKNLKNILKKQKVDRLIFSESSFKKAKNMAEKLLKEDIKEANKMIKINEKAIKILNGEGSKKEKIKKINSADYKEVKKLMKKFQIKI